MEKLFLYGPPASGKTALGRKLAGRLNLPFFDVDAEIERGADQSVSDIFSREGESGFRTRERDALAHVVARKERLVCSLGGGALLDANNRALCERDGAVLFIDANPEVLETRVKQAPGKRPLLARPGGLATLMNSRAEHYASFPHRVIRAFRRDRALVLEGVDICRVFERFGYENVPGLEVWDVRKQEQLW